MTKQGFIAKYEGWFSYTRREELKKEMEADLESLFIALRQPPVIGSVCDTCTWVDLPDKTSICSVCGCEAPF